jgi:hypothetical protein
MIWAIYLNNSERVETKEVGFIYNHPLSTLVELYHRKPAPEPLPGEPEVPGEKVVDAMIPIGNILKIVKETSQG